MIVIPDGAKELLLSNSTLKNWNISVYNDNNEVVAEIPTSKMVDNSLSIKESLCSAQSLEFGSCEASVLTIKLADLDVTAFKDKKIVVKINIYSETEDTTTEIDLGTFFVDDVPHENNTWFYNLTAYDAMVKFDVNIHKWYEALSFPMTLKQFRLALCAHVGVETEPGQTLPLDDLTITKSTTDVNMTGRKALKAICELNAVFGHINRLGRLVFVSLGTNSVLTLSDHGANHYKAGATHENWSVPACDSAIAYSLKSVEGVVYPAAGGFNALMLGDNFLAYDLSEQQLAQVAHVMYDSARVVSYTAHNTTIQGRVWLEVGDRITLDSDGEEIGTYILERTLTGFQAMTDKLSAKATDKRNEDRSSTQQQIERMKRDANEIRADYLKADVAEITYATIENLNATNATITNLEAVNANITGRLTAAEANIGTLHADKADITDLTAATARIGYLEGDVASFHSTYTENLTAINADIANLTAVDARIENLVATKATITDLNAAVARIGTLDADVATIDTLMFGSASGTTIQTSFSNAVIAQLGNAQIQNAMIDSVSASKITAGNIYTNAVRIYGDSTGKLSIVDNTMQISDGTNVRVQIGKDASNDYNLYVWDSSGNLLFDAVGLTHNGISRKIIRDDVVMDNANIGAHKLDINSLFTVINNDNSHTLSSSKILLDTQNQLLDVAFTNLTTTVTNHGTAISSQGTAIGVIQGQISSKIWQQDITDITDPMNTTMTTQYSTLTQTIKNFNVSLGSEITSIQQQLDGASDTWTGTETPTLDNYPAADWVTNGELQRHVGNMYFDNNGYSYRFMSSNVFTLNGVVLVDNGDSLSNYYWMPIRDSEVSRALQDSAAALEGVAGLENTILTNYSTTSQMHSAINVAIDNITSTVSSTYATKGEVVAKGAETLSSANTYSDGIGTAAANDATTKANAAEGNAKGYFDTKIADYSKTVDVRSMIRQTAENITSTVSSNRTELIEYANGIGTAAAADATTKANTAQSNAAADATAKANAAEANAAADATAKANAAESRANGYTENRLTSYSTTSVVQSMIDQKADSITQTVSGTYTTKAEYAQFEVGARNLILNSIDLVGITHYIYSYNLVDNNVILLENGQRLVH